jgi:hypothetical protein
MRGGGGGPHLARALLSSSLPFPIPFPLGLHRQPCQAPPPGAANHRLPPPPSLARSLSFSLSLSLSLSPPPSPLRSPSRHSSALSLRISLSPRSYVSKHVTKQPDFPLCPPSPRPGTSPFSTHFPFIRYAFQASPAPLVSPSNLATPVTRASQLASLPARPASIAVHRRSGRVGSGWVRSIAGLAFACVCPFCDECVEGRKGRRKGMREGGREGR